MVIFVKLLKLILCRRFYLFSLQFFLSVLSHVWVTSFISEERSIVSWIATRLNFPNSESVWRSVSRRWKNTVATATITPRKPIRRDNRSLRIWFCSIFLGVLKSWITNPCLINLLPSLVITLSKNSNSNTHNICSKKRIRFIVTHKKKKINNILIIFSSRIDKNKKID